MALDNPEHFPALAARYCNQERPDRILWNETIARQLAHSSVRSYLPTPLHADAATLDAHDGASRSFQREQSQSEIGWIAPDLARMADAKAIGKRERLRETHNNRGFALL